MGAAIIIASVLGLIILFLLYKNYYSWLIDRFDYDAFSFVKIIINIILLFMVIVGGYKFFYHPSFDPVNTQVIFFSGSALLILFNIYVAIKTNTLNSLTIFIITVPLALLLLRLFLLSSIFRGSSEPETKTIYKNRDIPSSGKSLF